MPSAEIDEQYEPSVLEDQPEAPNVSDTPVLPEAEPAAGSEDLSSDSCRWHA